MNDTLEIYAQAIRRIEYDINAFREKFDEDPDANPHFAIDNIEATLYELTEILSARSDYAS